MTLSKKNHQNEFYSDHAITEKKTPSEIFSVKMLIAYGVSAFIVWVTFFAILPKILYDKSEGWRPYFTTFWKGYDLLLVHNQMLCSCGITLFITLMAFIVLTLFYLLVFGDEA